MRWVSRGRGSVASQDKSAKSRRVLRMRFPDACIYGDIFDYVPDLPAWEALAKLTPTQRQAQVDERYQGGGRHCCSHQAACAPRVAHGDIAGSPCPPWSAAGARKGWGDSRTVCTQVWVAHIKTTLPDFCVHENVPPFPAEYISEQLQEEYHIFHVSSNVSDLSWNVVRRKRVFSCLLRRQAVSLIADVALLYQQICRQVAQRMAPLSVTDICVATLEELLCEENKVRSRKKLPLVEAFSGDWTPLLTQKQHQYLTQYCHMWQSLRGAEASSDECCVVDLTQNPQKRPSWSLRGPIPTLRHAGCLLWLPSRRRWLLARELAVAHGFAVDPQCAKAAYVAYDAITASEVSARDLGNGVHVAQMAAIVAATLASGRPKMSIARRWLRLLQLLPTSLLDRVVALHEFNDVLNSAFLRHGDHFQTR